MPIYFSWFITALLFGKWWSQQSQPTAKWAPFILRVMAWLRQLGFRQLGTGLQRFSVTSQQSDYLRTQSVSLIRPVNFYFLPCLTLCRKAIHEDTDL